MQQFFMESGYRVASGGKVFHGHPGKIGDALLPRPRDPRPPEGENNFNAMRAPNDGYALNVELLFTGAWRTGKPKGWGKCLYYYKEKWYDEKCS